MRTVVAVSTPISNHKIKSIRTWQLAGAKSDVNENRIRTLT